jgi:hypothetical protein
MKKSSIISVIALIIIWTSLSLAQKDDSMNHIEQNDTTYYHVEIGIEGGVTQEYIKTYPKNGKLVADIIKTSFCERHYVGQPVYRSKQDTLASINNWILSKSKIDTIENFKKMVTTNTVRHNQGTKIAGRHGDYSVIENGDTFTIQSRELYSLTDALRFERR